MPRKPASATSSRVRRSAPARSSSVSSRSPRSKRPRNTSPPAISCGIQECSASRPVRCLTNWHGTHPTCSRRRKPAGQRCRKMAPAMNRCSKSRPKPLPKCRTFPSTTPSWSVRPRWPSCPLTSAGATSAPGMPSAAWSRRMPTTTARSAKPSSWTARIPSSRARTAWSPPSVSTT